MDIDAAAPPPGAAAKGKAPLSSTPGGRAAPWVEKYRPQSLGDVAAHRDIVDTSKLPPLPPLVSPAPMIELLRSRWLPLGVLGF
jgi:hypothetical protein